MKVLFIEETLQDIPDRTCVLDFSDAGEMRYLHEDEQFFEKDIARPKEPSVSTCLFGPYRDCSGKGNYQIWDELIKPSSKLILFNDPIRMGEIYATDANDMVYNIPKTRDMIKWFLLWLSRKKWVDVVYILCSKNSFVRKIKFS
jgi:hypothetical protein